MDHIQDPNRAARLHKFWNSAIPDGRTWSKFGERGEHEKDEKHQPDQNTLLMIQNTLFVTQNVRA